MRTLGHGEGNNTHWIRWGECRGGQGGTVGGREDGEGVECLWRSEGCKGRVWSAYGGARGARGGCGGN